MYSLNYLLSLGYGNHEFKEKYIHLSEFEIEEKKRMIFEWIKPSPTERETMQDGIKDESTSICLQDRFLRIKTKFFGRICVLHPTLSRKPLFNEMFSGLIRKVPQKIESNINV